ncbi:MAG: hypothetical protein COV43_07905 [Deltaproteobacteria bacterium CG11_big_fil_rev_8_21_14_0_20_42_23]|nr:MAG: hypothetical protein COV43_07905 [Deltaproteobacteria bacterium CG11_big_fil_rev_8_21_14_0_20_42_23]PJC63916.1 MAG: hypothetical protein CO021_07060 [Deltaproteobacteria bacterium CG_4_9_14_0_2_um_filter_42_21]
MKKIFPKKVFNFILFLCIMAEIVLPSSSAAYNFIFINQETKKPVGYKVDISHVYYIDPGPFENYTKEQLRLLVEEAFRVWSSIEDAQLPSFVFGGFLDEDVTGENIDDYIPPQHLCYTDLIPLGEACKNEFIQKNISLILFDDDSSISEQRPLARPYSGATFQQKITGSPSKPENYLQTSIVISTIHNNFREIFGTLVHEIGHLFGLAHTSLNQQFIDNVEDDFALQFGKFVPTMFSVKNIGFGLYDQKALPKPDDVLGIQNLYPSTNLKSNSASIRGYIVDEDGEYVYLGNIIARNIEDPLCKAYSFIAGNVNCREGDKSTCSGPSEFSFNHLPPGAYTIEIEGYANQTSPEILWPGFNEDTFLASAEYWNIDDQANESPLLKSIISVSARESVDDIILVVDSNNRDEVTFIPESEFSVFAPTTCEEIDFLKYQQIITPDLVLSDSASSSSSSGGCSLILSP